MGKSNIFSPFTFVFTFLREISVYLLTVTFSAALTTMQLYFLFISFLKDLFCIFAFIGHVDTYRKHGQTGVEVELYFYPGEYLWKNPIF